MFHRLAADNARRLGVSRRDFVSSTMGTATALFVINAISLAFDAVDFAKWLRGDRQVAAA